MPEVTLFDFGIAGVFAGVAFKALDLAILAIRNYANAKKKETPPSLPDLLDRRQGDDNQNVINAKLDEILRRLIRLEKVVIDGNGREPLTTQIAVIRSDLKNHIQDKGLHTSEK